MEEEIEMLRLGQETIEDILSEERNKAGPPQADLTQRLARLVQNLEPTVPHVSGLIIAPYKTCIIDKKDLFVQGVLQVNLTNKFILEIYCRFFTAGLLW